MRFPASYIRKCKRKWQREKYRSKWTRNPQERQRRSLMISQRACGTCSNDRLLKSKNDLAGIQTRQTRYGGVENIFSRNPGLYPAAKAFPGTATEQSETVPHFFMPLCGLCLNALFFIVDVLHQVGGLTIQNSANFVQGFNRQMLHGTRTNSGNRRRANTCLFRKFLLRHFIDSKHNFDLELNHGYHLFHFESIPRNADYFNTNTEK